MFLYTHRHNKPYYLSCCPADTGTFLGMGLGWGNNIHIPVLTQAQQTLSCFLLSSRHRHLSRDGVGWGNNVHIPVLTQAQQTLSSFLLSSRRRHNSFMISYRWGGVITVMFLCIQAQQTLLSFLLSSRHRHLSGDGVGWGNNVHVPVDTQAQQTLLSFLLSSRHRHYSWLISYKKYRRFLFACSYDLSRLSIRSTFQSRSRVHAIFFRVYMRPPDHFG